MTIREDSDRHNLYLQKLASGLYSARVYPSLEAARLAVRSMLLDAEELKTIEEVKRIQASIEKEVSSTMGTAWAGVTSELEDLAVYEAAWQVQAISAYTAAELKEPSRKKIQSFIDSAVMSLHSGPRVNAGVWSDFVRGQMSSMANTYNGLIVSGYQQGLTVNQIAKSIKDATDGVIAREAETLARTGLNHYTANAREAMAAENSAIKYRLFSATFDNRTTIQCRANSGKTWAISDQSYPRLPLHYGERSSYVYLTDLSEAKQGKKSSVGGKEAESINPSRKLKYRGRKDRDIFKAGPIDAGLTQDQWLREQPRWFVESALDSKTKAALFLDGGMSINKFVDMQGRPITLDRLRELDAEAFTRAGL
jgi:SPP1 gp7 family putative phage head morphogenesis protein